MAVPISFIPATACTACKVQGPGQRPVQEWQEAEVCQWLSEVFLAPQELVQMVEQQAITGKVLLSLTESDLAELSVPKFGHRRLLMLAAHELRHLAGATVNPAPSYAFQAPASSPSGSVNGSGPQLCVGGPVVNGNQAPPSVRSTLPGALKRGVQVLQYPCAPQSAISPSAQVGGRTLATPRVRSVVAPVPGPSLDWKGSHVAAPVPAAAASQCQVELAPSPRDTVEDASRPGTALRSRSMSPTSPSHRFAWEPLAHKASSSLTRL